MPRPGRLAQGQVQPGVFQMGVGLVQAHVAACGDTQGLVEVALGLGEGALDAIQGGPRQEATG